MRDLLNYKHYQLYTPSKNQPEDGPTNWAETFRWNYNLI